MSIRTCRPAMPLVLFFGLIAFPFIAEVFAMTYYVGFVRYVLIIAISAVSLNFLLGYGGMVALGQAAFSGVGAYTLIGLMMGGVDSFFVLMVGAGVVAMIVSALVGLVCLRTRGIYFIMITLAFAQMLYFLATSASILGGADGYSLLKRPQLLGLDMNDEATWYGIVLFISFAVFTCFQRISQSHFGHALAGIRDNESRMTALGYPIFWYKFIAFVGAGTVTGLAGALSVIDSGFYSPSSMHWTQSALLIVMVILGGIGRLWGTLIGVAVWITMEEVMRQFTDYWHWPLGLILILVVPFAPRGLAALWSRDVRAAS